MKTRLLRRTGVALMAAGAVAVIVVVAALLIAGAATDRAQDRLIAEFEANQASAATSTTTTPATTTPVEDDPTIITVTTTPGEDVAGPTFGTTTVPDLIPEEPPDQGEALGRILIPAAGVDWVIIEGVTLGDLAQGPGHMPGTAMPGQPGNSVISGHRTTHGAPFYSLDLLRPGDEITIETLIGTHVYEVVEVRIVAPSDVWVTGPADGAWLTLTTCNPIYRSIERLIVFARLVGGPNSAAVAATLTGDAMPPQPPGA